MARLVKLERGGGCSLPDRVVFVDCEPKICMDPVRKDLKIHSFQSGYASVVTLRNGVIQDKISLQFANTWMFWRLLESTRDTKKATWIFGHNLGYDLTLLGFWDWLAAGGAEMVGCILEDPPTVITVRRGKRLLRFVDVLNYWRLSVCDLATSVLHGGGCSIKPGDRQSSKPETCQQHVEVIESCMLRLIHLLAETRCCSLRGTAAGLSWGTYVKSFLPMTLHISSSRRLRALERRSYYAGRVEVRHIGSVREAVYQLDINSLYPTVMLQNQFPCRLISHPYGLRPGELKSALRDYDAVAECDLYPSEYYYPVRSGVHVSYVRGPVTTVLAGDELRAACDRCDVANVRDTYLYERADLFSSFVKHWYAKKSGATKAGNRADELIYKMMLNCLHGKFAQHGRRWSPEPRVVSRGYYEYWWHKMAGRPAPCRARSVAGHVEVQVQGDEPRYCFPAISACITSSARVSMASDLRSCGVHNVCYTDTDSIHTLRDGLERLARLGRMDESKIGHFRVVAQGDSAFYWGHQHYRVGDKFVCSSIKPDAVEVADGVYLQDAVAGVERTLETGRLDHIVVTPRIIDMSGRSRDAKRQAVLA